jgi:hypothetical protein
VPALSNIRDGVAHFDPLGENRAEHLSAAVAPEVSDGSRKSRARRLSRGNPLGIHPIAGVPTSITAFVGAAAKGPVASPVLVSSFLDFATQYGGLTDGMPLGYAVQQYFANGGSEALIARVESIG